MVHWIWAVSPKKWWFATVYWYHHLLKNCWLFLMISHHIPIIHQYIYIYVYVFRYHHFSLWSHQISWWNDHSSPLNSCKRTPFILLQIIWGTKQVYSKYPNATSMQKVLKLWVFTGSTHPFYGSTEGQPVCRPPAGSGLLEFRRPPRRSRSSSSPEPGDRRRGGRPSRRHRPSARDTWGGQQWPRSGHASWETTMLKTIRGKRWILGGVEWMSQWGREVFISVFLRIRHDKTMGEISIVTMVPIIGMDGAMGHFRWLASRLNNCQVLNSFFQQQWVGRMWGTMAVHPTSSQRKSASKRAIPVPRSRLFLGSFGQHTWLSGLTSSQCDRRASFCASQTAFMKWLFLIFFQAVSEGFFQQTGTISAWCRFKPVTIELIFWGFECTYRTKKLINWDDHPIF